MGLDMYPSVRLVRINVLMTLVSLPTHRKVFNTLATSLPVGSFSCRCEIKGATGLSPGVPAASYLTWPSGCMAAVRPSASHQERSSAAS